MSDSEPTYEARSGPVRLSTRSTLAIALAALVAFAALGAIVSSGSPGIVDRAVRRSIIAALSPNGTSFFTLVSTVGSVTPMMVYSAVVITAVAIFRRSMAPLATLFAPAVAVPAYLGAKSLFLRTRPSGVGNAFEGTYSFPSAHATTSSAVCSAVAYLLFREGLLSRGAAVAATGILCVVIGVSRVYLDVHWATDILGGWCLGLAIGATASALYAVARGAEPRALAGDVR